MASTYFRTPVRMPTLEANPIQEPEAPKPSPGSRRKTREVIDETLGCGCRIRCVHMYEIPCIVLERSSVTFLSPSKRSITP